MSLVVKRRIHQYEVLVPDDVRPRRYIPPLSVQLTIPSLVFRSATGKSYNFNERGPTYLTRINGLGVPPLINETVQTPSRDGETYIRTVLEPRFIKIHMTMVGSTFAALQDERRRLIAILNPRLGVGRIEYTPVKGKTYGIDAIIEAGADFTDHPAATVENLTLSFRCPDPAFHLRSAEPLTFNVLGGMEIPWGMPMDIGSSDKQEAVFNPGDLPSFPQFVITGPLSSPVVKNLTTNKTVSLSGYTLEAGSTLVIDMAAQTIKVDGVSKIGEMTATSELWALAPGTNDIKVSVGGGNSIFRMTFTARYLGI